VLRVGLENSVLGFNERPQALGREKGRDAFAAAGHV
jgi:hypothetical protein